MAEQGYVQHTLEPWYDAHSKVLILGTMPSVMSRKALCYYGHPQNRFWITLSHVFDDTMPMDTESRRAFCRRHGIALWDVLASCDIRGSDDASIRNAIANDIPRILEACNIRAIFTTGKKAKALYDSLLLERTGREAIALPSPSPANRRWAPQEVLDNDYAVVASICGK